MKHLLFIELNIRGEFLTERTIVGYKKYTLQVHECNMTTARSAQRDPPQTCA